MRHVAVKLKPTGRRGKSSPKAVLRFRHATLQTLGTPSVTPPKPLIGDATVTIQLVGGGRKGWPPMPSEAAGCLAQPWIEKAATSTRGYIREAPTPPTPQISLTPRTAYLGANPPQTRIPDSPSQQSTKQPSRPTLWEPGPTGQNTQTKTPQAKPRYPPPHPPATLRYAIQDITLGTTNIEEGVTHCYGERGITTAPTAPTAPTATLSLTAQAHRNPYVDTVKR